MNSRLRSDTSCRRCGPPAVRWHASYRQRGKPAENNVVIVTAKSSANRPAVLRLFGDWAEESTLPMLPSVCFAAGRVTSTQSSWTVLDHCSRKWMSGQADALTATKDRRRCAEKTYNLTTLRETPSPGRTPSLLDFYLSWMSLYFSFILEIHGGI